MTSVARACSGKWAAVQPDGDLSPHTALNATIDCELITIAMAALTNVSEPLVLHSLQNSAIAMLKDNMQPQLALGFALAAIAIGHGGGPVKAHRAAGMACGALLMPQAAAWFLGPVCLFSWSVLSRHTIFMRIGASLQGGRVEYGLFWRRLVQVFVSLPCSDHRDVQVIDVN